jgi:peptide/nickel transport system substrate-binding protein
VIVRIYFLVLFLVTVNIAVTHQGTAAAESMLRVKGSANVGALDPVGVADFDSRNVLHALLEGLVAPREDMSTGLMLAEAVEIGADRLSYRFTLRQGVTFHNGEPLDAEAVAFAWRRYLDPAAGWRCLPQFDGRVGGRVLRVSAPDPLTVLFELETQHPFFLEQMARLDCLSAGIFHRDSLDSNGQWLRPIGTGPFKLGEFRRGEFLELLKFSDYRSLPGPRDGMTGGKTPLVDKVRLLSVPIERVPTALFGRQLDLDPDFSSAAAEIFQGHEDFVLQIKAGFELNGLLFQTKDPLLSDPRMRRAILLGLDREVLVRQVSFGRIGAVHSPIPSSSPYSGELQRAALPYDPVEGKRLLGESGYAGQPIRMLASRRYMTVFLAAVIAKDMLQKIGVTVELEELGWDALFDRYAKGDYQLMMFSFSPRLDPAQSFEMITGPKATQPQKVWSDALAIDLVRRATLSADPIERRRLLDQLQERFVADLPMIPLWNSPSLALHHKRVKGFSVWSAQTPRYWGISME